MTVNYETIDKDIIAIERLTGPYDDKSADFYKQMHNVLAYAKEQRELDRS